MEKKKRYLRNIYLTLLSLATIAAICYGTFTRIGMPVLHISDDDFFFGFYNEGNETTKKEIEPFSSVRIELKNADISLKSGADYLLNYRGNKSRFPVYHMENDALVISDPSTGKAPTGLLTVIVPKELSSMGEWDISTANGDVTVAFDQEVTIGAVNISSENGDLKLHSRQTLTGDAVKLNSKNGDLSLSNWNGNSLHASSDNGDVTAEKICFETTDLTSDTGDLSVKPSDHLSEYRYHLTGGEGDISIADGIYDGSPDSKSEITVGKGEKDMTLRSQNGDIVVQ
ncbi:MAG: DUF4097 family beta strand repeat-containing protein [Lachnospiraceae bacterium]|nr:DUF4097 family beta strand repeat-containing protein [Lachnospiraceae bacterium]